MPNFFRQVGVTGDQLKWLCTKEVSKITLSFVLISTSSYPRNLLVHLSHTKDEFTCKILHCAFDRRIHVCLERLQIVGAFFVHAIQMILNWPQLLFKVGNPVAADATCGPLCYTFIKPVKLDTNIIPY